MNADYPIAFTRLKALAPLELESHRSQRYGGEHMALALDDFAEQDQQRIRRLYSVLSDLLLLLKRKWEHPDDASAQTDLLQFMRDLEWTSFLQEMRQIGHATNEYGTDPMRSQVVHDIKGGGFMALSLYLQLLEHGSDKAEDTARMFFLCRDHLKIMRNALRGIDLEGEANDHAHKDHSARLFVEKWAQAVHRLEHNSAEVVLDCHFDGMISERCLEFSAIDRVLYNLINNATRHTANGKVYLTMFPLNPDHPQHLRCVVYNALQPEHQQVLEQRYNGSLGTIFRGGFTTGGTGEGLRICADFINHAYGISNFEEGLQGGYFGAQLLDNYFVNWVHWPTLGD